MKEGIGVVGKLLDPEANMKILHSRKLRDKEVQAKKYVFYDPEVLKKLRVRYISIFSKRSAAGSGAWRRGGSRRI
jgi:hypothetical protein